MSALHSYNLKAGRALMSITETPSYLQYVAIKKTDRGHGLIVKNKIESVYDIISQIDPKNREDSPEVNDKKEQSDETVDKNNDDTLFEDFIRLFSEGMKSSYHIVRMNNFSKSVMKSFYVERTIFKYSSENLDLITEKDGFKVFGVKRTKIFELQNTLRDYERLSDGANHLPNAAIMALVAIFDAHFSSLARNLISRYPERVGLQDKTIDVSVVLKSKSIDEVKFAIIEDQIHSLMRGSHDEQISFIERFGRKIRDTADYPLFLEVFERRNLAAHGEDFANRVYVERCNSYKVPKDKCLKFGDPLNLDTSYLNNSIDILFEFGFLTAWWLWTKLENDKIERAYEVAVSTTYNLLVEGRYGLAEKIACSVLNREERSMFEIERRMLCVNRVIALKNIADDSWSDELNRFGWVAVDNRFQAAYRALKEDCDGVCELMPYLTDDTLVGEDGFRNWPLFKWVREQESYQQKFFEVFGSQLRD